MSEITLFHVTPQRNRYAILHAGIDPSLARGKNKVVWLCDSERLMWAFTHVSVSHAIAADDCIVAVCQVDASLFQRTAWRGVYTSRQVVQVHRFSTVDMALRLEERLNFVGEQP